MAPRKAAAKKAAERASLKDIRSITITVRASELNLQRLAAFMLFAEHLEPVIEIGGEKPMPWEDPADPRFVPPTDSIDYAVVRRDITGKLLAYFKQFGEDRAKDVLRSFGAERLSLLADDQLIPLHDALKAALEPAQPETTE